MNDRVPAQRRYEVASDTAGKSRDLLMELWERCWAGANKPTPPLGPKFEWFYLQNPAGEANSHRLIDLESSEIVGMLMGVPRVFLVDGREQRGVGFMDFLVAAEHRSFAPAVKLQGVAHEAELQTATLAYAIPNPRAARLCERANVGFRFNRPRFAVVIRHAPYLARTLPDPIARLGGAILDVASSGLRLLRARALPRLQGEWVNDFDQRFDALWSRVPTTGRLIGVRDSEFLRWRFLRQPGRTYRTLTVRAPGAAELIGYFVSEMQGNVLSVRDFLTVGGVHEQLAAWRTLWESARECGAQGITCDVQADRATTDVLRRSGYKVRGSTMVFVDLTERCRDVKQNDPESWYLTPADEDI